MVERGELYEYGATDFRLSERNRGKSKADTSNGVIATMTLQQENEGTAMSFLKNWRKISKTFRW